MTTTTRTFIACLLASIVGLAAHADADLSKADAAYQRGDFATALREFQPLARLGDPRSQIRLASLYYEGQGVPQDYKEAVKWFRLAADQGDAVAQRNLGVMYADGWGVPQSPLLAYALYSLAAANDPSNENAANYRTDLADKLTPSELERGQALTREMRSSANVSTVLSRYMNRQASAEPEKRLRKTRNPGAAVNSGPYPARPDKVPGLTSSRTSCMNASCYRTYDDGRKVHFFAKQKWDPLTNQFEFDSGTC